MLILIKFKNAYIERILIYGLNFDKKQVNSHTTYMQSHIKIMNFSVSFRKKEADFLDDICFLNT